MDAENKSSTKYIYPLDKNTISFYGYQIKRDGEILNKQGKPLSKCNIVHEESHVTINFNGVQRKYRVARLVYYLFFLCPDYSKFQTIWKDCKDVLIFKDGDCKNAAYENLKMVSRKEYHMIKEEQGIQKRKIFKDEEAQQIRREYKQNKYSHRKLCKEYSCSLSTIRKILNGCY